jgi:hypothetical protein
MAVRIHPCQSLNLKGTAKSGPPGPCLGGGSILGPPPYNRQPINPRDFHKLVIRFNRHPQRFLGLLSNLLTFARIRLSNIKFIIGIVLY